MSESQRVLSIDIGSTYTKGARWLVCPTTHVMVLQDRAFRPTSRPDISEGFFAMYEELGPCDLCTYSSSAAGGLAIAAIGLVPELTAQAAAQCAMCAGGRITGTYAYKLAKQDLDDIALSEPDVILICGGTDGGDEKFVRHNVALLAELSHACVFVYAGNRNLQDYVLQTLRPRPVTVTDNVLPTIDTLQIEPARAAIRAVFLEHIVHSKGLTPIVEKTGRAPLPTPFAMYEFMKCLALSSAVWASSCLVDIGGATTDVYSHCKDINEGAFIQKGLSEPMTKRSVEGDLGLRVSAPATWETGRSLWPGLLSAKLDGFEATVRGLQADPSQQLNDSKDQCLEAALAQVCFRLGLTRHIGTCRRVFTPLGEQFLIEGKDLRPIDCLIITGGYLSRFDLPASWFQPISTTTTATDIMTLWPSEVTVYRDDQYLLPLLACVAQVYPEAAIRMAEDILQRQPQTLCYSSH